MNGLPWGITGQGFESDAGGLAELQTDVMRFMAILAFCLLAVFALVQSVPMAPPALEEPETAAPEPVANATPPVAASSPRPAEGPPAQPAPPMQRTVPRPARRPATVAPPVQAKRKAPVRAPAAPVVAPPVPAEDPALAAERTYTLRFESDAVLRRLVANGDVGVYALAGGQGWQLSVRGEGLSMTRVKVPSSLYVMVRESLSAEIERALALVAGPNPAEALWGVTLPATVRGQITAYVDASDPGALVIGPGGTVRREGQ